MSHAIKSKVVIANNIGEIESAAAKAGYRPDQVFFKCSRDHSPAYGFTMRPDDDPMVLQLGNGVNVYPTYPEPSTRFEIEFMMLGDIYGIVPSNVVRPIALVIREAKDFEGDRELVVAGYMMEYTQGRTMHAHYRSIYPGKNLFKIVDTGDSLNNQLVDIVVRMHAHGVGHGDLQYTNAVITEDGVKLRDPGPYNAGVTSILHLLNGGYGLIVAQDMADIPRALYESRRAAGP